MLSKFSYDARSNMLLVVTALIVAYVRTYFHYHSYGWESLSEFLTSWLVHYLGLALFIVLSGAFVMRFVRAFLDPELHHTELSASEVKVYLTLTILAGAIALLVLGHWPASGASDLVE